MKAHHRSDANVHAIPIDCVRVVNPRNRDQMQHRNVTESIRATGLRRPIAVTRHEDRDGSERFDLVCGQGRLEALRALGHHAVPAVIIDATEEDCLVMSLIENIARRTPSAIEVMREVGHLRERGRTDVEIAELIGTSPSWVSMVGGLLDKGEERLLAAVQTGVMSLAMAADIAKASTAEIQGILNDAYEQGIRGKKMAQLRRLLEARAQRSPQLRSSYKPAARSQRKPPSAAEVRGLLEKEAERQRFIAKNAEFVSRQLAFCTGALKELLHLPEFRTLVKSEGIASMPRMLAERMKALP